MAGIRTTVVVGGGASGALAAGELLRGTDDDVVLVQAGDDLAKGLAYRTTEKSHLLNSRAGTMSGYADDPAHFVTWCQQRGMPVGPDDFLPRRVYGGYLREVLDTEAAMAPGRLRLVRDEVTRIALDGQVELRRRDGPALRADRAVLAFGHAAPNHPRGVVAQVVGHPGYVADPWRPHALDELPRDAPVLLLGTGLTAVDVMLSLTAQGHRAPIHAISRRGLLPLSHLPEQGALISPELPAGYTLAGVIAAVRRTVAETGDWRAVVDGLRGRAESVWSGLSSSDRERFVRHAARHWEVHRHRMAPPVAASVKALLDSGQLRVGGAALTSLTPQRVGLSVTARISQVIRHWLVAAVINCTGPGGAADAPLGRTMLADGLARRDELRLGLDVDEDGRLVAADGRPQHQLRVIGPPRRGRWWETTAIPEIRAQAAALVAADRRSGAPEPSTMSRITFANVVNGT